jgi:hypothetical protein
MTCLLCALMLAVSSPGEGMAGGSFLWQPSYCVDHWLRGPARPYAPQPGDIFLCTTESAFLRAAHHLAGASDPHHSGLVVARSDGRLAVLEAGPHNTLHVRLRDALPHLASYAHGRVWIRQRRVPLTAEQSARLTAFAEAQDGKRFAWGRLLAQMTPLRSRGPVRTQFLGGPHGERRSYFCSELVMEACVAAGLVDAATARPVATYPRDLFFDRSPNPYLDRTLRLWECWEPPARWTSCPCPGPGAQGATVWPE